MISLIQTRLLSPALSSIPNGGEGVDARAIHAAFSCARNNARLIPSPRSDARGEGQGEGLPGFSKVNFTSHK